MWKFSPSLNYKSRSDNLPARHLDAPGQVGLPPPQDNRSSTHTAPRQPALTRPPPAWQWAASRAAAATRRTPRASWTGRRLGSWCPRRGTAASSRASLRPAAGVGGDLWRGTPDCAGRARGWAGRGQGRATRTRCRSPSSTLGGAPTCSPTSPATQFSAFRQPLSSE